MKNIVILISGRGSNMEALIAARDAGRLSAKIAAVISNRADAKGLQTAEAAGISRVTLHRIEKGGTSVAMGAYGKTLTVLGLDFHVVPTDRPDTPADHKVGWIPARIALVDYPQLKTLAWHVRGIDTLSPVEAFDIYERNARHLESAKLTQSEQDLLEALHQAFANVPRHV